MHVFPRVSIIIVNTNELHHLKRCLPSICNQNYIDYEVIIVDNDSIDNSVPYIRCQFPQVRVIQNQQNLGYAGANNKGFDQATGDYIAVLNPDTLVEPDWLLELVQAIEKTPQAGLATPKILLMDDPTHINTCGNEITFSGLTVCRGLDQPADRFDKQEVVSAVSGAAFVIERSVIDAIGGFDESFFIYYEETDLSLRAMLAGYVCLYVPSSIVYHQYTFRFSAKKAFYQERNRYFSLIKTLRWRTLFILSPSLALAEVLAWGYSAICGQNHLRSKLNTYLWLARNWKHVLAARHQVQATRRVKDRVLIDRFGHNLTLAQTTHPSLGRIVEIFCKSYLFVMGRFGRLFVTW